MRTALTSLPCPIDDMIRTRVYESGRKGGKAQRSFRVKEFEPQPCWARRLCWNCMFAFAFTPACLNHRSEWRPIKGSKDQRGGEIVWKAKPFLFISHEHKLEDLANRPLLRMIDRFFNRKFVHLSRFKPVLFSHIFNRIHFLFVRNSIMTLIFCFYSQSPIAIDFDNFVRTDFLLKYH